MSGYKCPEKLGYYINYTLKAVRNNGWYTDDNWKIKRFIASHVESDEDFEYVKRCLYEASCTSQFIGYLMGTFNDDCF